MQVLILSDLHLGSKNCHAAEVLSLLESERFERLILNGDTLHSLNLRKLTPLHWAIIERLRQLRQRCNLILLRGNHDYDLDPSYLTASPNGFAGHRVLPALLDVPMNEDYRLEIGGRRYLVMHGDRFDPSLNGSLVADVGAWCFHMTRKVSKKLAKWMKKKSERWSRLVQCIRDEAVSHARNAGFSGIVTGHTHFAEDVLIDGVHYVNTGSWTEPPCTYAVVQEGELRLHQLAER